MISGAFQVTFRNCLWSCVTQLLCEDEPCGALRWWHRTKQDFNFPGSSDLITSTDGICNTDAQAGKKGARVWDIVQAPAYVEIRHRYEMERYFPKASAVKAGVNEYSLCAESPHFNLFHLKMKKPFIAIDSLHGEYVFLVSL